MSINVAKTLQNVFKWSKAAEPTDTSKLANQMMSFLDIQQDTDLLLNQAALQLRQSFNYDVLSDTKKAKVDDYLRQIRYMMGGNPGIKELHKAMPAEFGPKFEALIGESAQDIVNNLNRNDGFFDTYVGSELSTVGQAGGFTAKGAKRSQGVGFSDIADRDKVWHHLSTEKTYGEVRNHLIRFNDRLKEISRPYWENRYDSWEDFQRINLNKHIYAEQANLLKDLATGKMPKTAHNYDKIAEKLEKLPSLVLKGDEILHPSYLHMIELAGAPVDIHYLGRRSGRKFRVRVTPSQSNMTPQYRERYIDEALEGPDINIEGGIGVPATGGTAQFIKGQYGGGDMVTGRLPKKQFEALQ